MVPISSSVKPEATASHSVKCVTETMTVRMAATNTTAVCNMKLLIAIFIMTSFIRCVIVDIYTSKVNIVHNGPDTELFYQLVVCYMSTCADNEITFHCCLRQSLIYFWVLQIFHRLYPNVTTLRSGLYCRNSVCRLSSVCL